MLLPYLVKILISSVIIIAATEAAKKLPTLGALLVSLPLMTLITMCFLYYETRDNKTLADFVAAAPAAILPSFVFFFSYIIMAKYDAGFIIAFPVSLALMLLAYGAYLYLFKIGV